MRKCVQTRSAYNAYNIRHLQSQMHEALQQNISKKTYLRTLISI